MEAWHRKGEFSDSRGVDDSFVNQAVADFAHPAQVFVEFASHLRRSDNAIRAHETCHGEEVLLTFAGCVAPASLVNSLVDVPWRHPTPPEAL